MTFSLLAMQFRAEWSRQHPTCPPIGWLLRGDKNLPWVRFHALPDSKRYAENEEERRTILSRANALGDRLLGSGTPCWIVEARTDEDSDAGELALTFTEDDDPDSVVWHLYVRAEDWRSGAYDDKLLGIADDEPDRAIWVRRDNGAVFAPYDGGFDLFPSSWQEVGVLKKEKFLWLSSHPAGL
jgi:hypothetical protein